MRDSYRHFRGLQTKDRLDDADMNERFTDLTKKIVDNYHLRKTKAIEKAREILETPEDDLSEFDLDILEDY